MSTAEHADAQAAPASAPNPPQEVPEEVEQLSTTAQAGDPEEEQAQEQEQEQTQHAEISEEDKLVELLRKSKGMDGVNESPAENADLTNVQGSAQSSPRSANSSTKGMTEKAMKMLGFENEEQVLRAKALARMGLTEDDLYAGAPHFCSPGERERLMRVYEKKGLTEKLPKITGLTEEQLLRRKAVDKLGATESEIDVDRERKLSSLGATAAAVYHKEKESGISCLR